MNITRANQLKIDGPNGSKYYGGNQDWYSSNTWAMGGCGSVAGANALRSLARSNKQVRRDIINSKRLPSEVKSALCAISPSKENYSHLMTGIYNMMWAIELFPLNKLYDKCTRGDKRFRFIKPNCGLTNTGFIIGIIRYAARIGLNVKVRFLPTAYVDKSTGADFIKDGLQKSGSVVLLTSYNKHNLHMFPSDSKLESRLESSYKGYDASMKCHFATITDMDIDTDRLLITTWGQPAVADFNEVAKSWHSIKAFESTLMYIEPCTKAESIHCILSSWRPYVGGIVQSICGTYSSISSFIKKILHK